MIGHPAARLLADADDAELIVLGGRGHGGFAGLLLGSVSQRVATHAPCAVVVVRGRDDADGPPPAPWSRRPSVPGSSSWAATATV